MPSTVTERVRAEAASFRRAATQSIDMIRTVRTRHSLTPIERYASSQRLHWLRRQGIPVPPGIREQLGRDAHAHAKIAAIELQQLLQHRKQLLKQLKKA